MQGQKHKKLGKLSCFNSGEVNLIAKIDRTGYCLGKFKFAKIFTI